MFGVDFDGVFIEIANRSSHARQNPQHGDHVADIGYIFQAADILREQGSGNNGNSGIFGAADLNFTRQPVSAVDHKLFQKNLLFLFAHPADPDGILYLNLLKSRKSMETTLQ